MFTDDVGWYVVKVKSYTAI